ncbi:hypothetical protein BDV59DRAFT_166556 [Aspergillus ambiguus]|uniref:uncharacterized protein n=1 Tax=Aspergillus ambiguus TaxID=176160 RepID=UPI003CCD9DFA
MDIQDQGRRVSSITMAGDRPWTPKRPKLRSSCDACGAAKLKCDRGQPVCGRCVSHGIDCVYGVSRIMGKPPKSRSGRTVARQSSLDQETTETITFENNSASEAMLGPGLFFDATDDNTAMLNLPSLDFSEWAMTGQDSDEFLHQSLRFAPLPTPAVSGTGASSVDGSTAGFNQFESQFKRHTRPRPSTESSKNHDCLQDAYRILGSLTDVNLFEEYSALPNKPAVPLDHVLRLNREATEQLGSLLNCHCADSPNMALLLASSIARVLAWYQQAAACTPSPAWSEACPALESTSQQVSSAKPITGSDSGFSSSSSSVLASSSTMWADATTTDNSRMKSSGGNSASSSTRSEMPVMPARTTIGSFNVDDQSVQSALNIQLLLGEMRRAAGLIDQFIAWHGPGDQRLGDGVDGLYQSLDLWLRKEHSRIVETMKSMLQRLNK